MLTREIATQRVIAFLEDCAAKKIAISKAILFGSVANGSPGADADIDLLLVSGQFGDSIWQNAKLLAPISKHFTEIEVHPVTPAHFADGDPFIREVMRTGIVLR